MTAELKVRGNEPPELRQILEANFDYFTLVKSGMIGVNSVDFGNEGGAPFMDTYNAKGKKVLRYYIGSDYKLNKNKPAAL